MARKIVVSAILAFAIQAVMGANIPQPKEFFQQIKGNLSKIVWAHAVNSRAELEKALASDKIMMLEADVILGKIGDDSNNIPIMGHPPNITGDLSLSDFLKNVTQNNTKKGIKLDFKSIEAFEHSKDILKEHRDNLTFPVFINADILEGPVNSTANSTDSSPVDAKTFLMGVAEVLPTAVLSVGWTTRYGAKYNITEGRYTQEQIKKMLGTLAENKVNQTVTYPMRAGLITEDFSVVKKLLENGTNAKNATLTIWSHPEDKVDTDKLSHLIRELGVDKVYVDVPSDIWNKLQFSAAPALGSTMLMTLSAVVLSMIFSHML